MQPGTPRARPQPLRTPRHRLGCSSKPPPTGARRLHWSAFDCLGVADADARPEEGISSPGDSLKSTLERVPGLAQLAAFRRSAAAYLPTYCLRTAYADCLRLLPTPTAYVLATYVLLTHCLRTAYLLPGGPPLTTTHYLLSTCVLPAYCVLPTKYLRTAYCVLPTKYLRTTY